MAFYIYRCDCCEQEKEIMHPMSEVDKPSEKLLENITCCSVVMKRVPQLTSFNAFGMLSKEDKAVKLKKRSRDHFKKEIAEKKREEDKATFKSAVQ